MYDNVDFKYPEFAEGVLSRKDGTEYILPYTAEDEDCKGGVFAFQGTEPGITVVAKAKDDTSVPVGIILSVIFVNNDGAKGNSYYLRGDKVNVAHESFHIPVKVTNITKYKDYIFVKPTTGEIQSSSQDTIEGFVKTKFKVKTPNTEAGGLAEITDREF